MKRYIIRSVKYFLYLIIIMTLLLAILVLLGLAEADPAEIFVGGYSSYWKIGLAFLALASIYPRFGYSKNEIISGVELKPLILSVMDSRGYKLRSEEGDTMVFIKRSPLDRALRMWEDAISFTKTEAGYDIEGHTKEMVRCRSAILNVSSEE